jgi:hypothetical protein
MKNKPIISLLPLLLAPALAFFPKLAQAAQYQHCYYSQKVRIIQDSGNHSNAYDDGYREGAEAARRGDAYEARSVGGEFARGFEDGYHNRPYTGQQNVVPDRTETYQTRECRNYSYDPNDSIDEILENVLNQFERDLRHEMENNRRMAQ